MKTKIVKTKDGEKIKLEIIEKFDNYREFYFLHKDGVYTKANLIIFCSAIGPKKYPFSVKLRVHIRVLLSS